MILQESPCHKNYDNFTRASARWKLKFMVIMVISFLSFFEFFFGLQIQLNWGVNLSENDHREPSPMIEGAPKKNLNNF